MIPILLLIAVDILFIVFCLLLVWPFKVYKQAAYAILKRNFVSYFSTPTGYVFLCLFVLLTSFAAFWPHEFFTSNLANLDQLNQYLPLIMLIFIPAITMSIWAEEKRQGTDELLLTLPANDFDIVIGKYLSAAAIFTASLLFSQVCNFLVLVALSRGDLDAGLFFATYFGYWMIGLAMLGLGMVASFLTSNLTVGFILGVAFNAPLVFAANADIIVPNSTWARNIARWSILEQFSDFGKGMITLSSMSFFVMVAAFGIFLCMVLIGARHWYGGRDGESLFWQYVVRIIALMMIVMGVSFFFFHHDWFRYDATIGKIGSLSPDAVKLIEKLDSDEVIRIDAFISEDLPEEFVAVRADLVSMLQEFQSLRTKQGEGFVIQVHDNLQTFSDTAKLAEDRYNITPRVVLNRSRGKLGQQEILLGAAFQRGLQRVVVPFFEPGVRVEYELIRSIYTVAQAEQKKIGVVRTDAQLTGGFSFAGGRPQQIPKSAIIEELEKQYLVEEVDPSSAIEVGKYDALLVVQPSSLSPEGMNHLIDAIKQGQPTAIFEDPLPSGEFAYVPATGAPKQAPGGGMFGMQSGGPPPPKGDIKRLWKTLGITSPGEPASQPNLFEPAIAWQSFWPYERSRELMQRTDQWVLASNETPGGENSLSADSSVTAGLEEILFITAGVINPSPNSNLKFSRLVSTGEDGGTISNADFTSAMRGRNVNDLIEKQGAPSGRKTLAAFIHGDLPEESDGPDKAHEDDPAEEKPADRNGEEEESDDDKKSFDEMRVIYVADTDLLMSDFLQIRNRPEQDPTLRWRFENVTFVLNMLDFLAGQEEFVNVRKRKPHHATLRLVSEMADKARLEEEEKQRDFQEVMTQKIKGFEDKQKEALAKAEKEVEKLREKQRAGEENVQEEFEAIQQTFGQQQQLNMKRLAAHSQQVQADFNKQVQEIRRATDLKIRRTQNLYKMMAIIFPPIPPLLIGIFVFAARRLRERETISRSRLK